MSVRSPAGDDRGGDGRTLVKLLVANARAHPRRPAMRERERGIWREYTRETVLGQVRALALGLHALGLGRDEKVAIVSENRPEAFWMLSAAQAVGAVPVPVYQDAIAKEVQYIIDHSDARFVLAEDQEQVDKLLEARGGLPKVERVFYDDPRGLRHYDRDWLMPLEELARRGQEVDAAHPRLFDELVAAGGLDDVAIIVYTSGTTGTPKGAMLTHRNVIASAEQFLAREALREDDEHWSYLPIAWIGEIAFSLGLGCVRGLTINFPERPETMRADFREIGAHIVLGGPRAWEARLSGIQVRIEDSSRLKRWVFHRFMPIGEEVARREMERRPVPLGLRLLGLLGEILVFGPIRDEQGFRRAGHVYTGGAPLGPEVFLFFRGLGINIKQLYGQTENCAFCCGQPYDGVKLGTVGLPFPGVELRLTDEGEIVSRSPATFAGYYRNPEATREVLRDGWLYSGDAGFFDQEGHLVVVDRIKDVTRLTDGTTLAPQFLENKLKFSPYVKEAVVVGQDRPFVAALINIDMDTVGKWAERRQIAYTTYADLAQRPEVYELIFREVERVNQDLPPATRIRKYLLLHKELDPDDEEITRTRKVRRRVVAEKYAAFIDAFYGDRDEVEVATTITYEDGRRATIQSHVRIEDVAAGVPVHV